MSPSRHENANVDSQVGSLLAGTTGVWKDFPASVTMAYALGAAEPIHSLAPRSAAEWMLTTSVPCADRRWRCHCGRSGDSMPRCAGSKRQPPPGDVLEQFSLPAVTCAWLGHVDP